MPMILILTIVLILLIVMISVFKVSPFIAFIAVSIIAGFMMRMPVIAIANSINKGIGDMLSSILILLCSGAMIGKLVAESGAAQVISITIMRFFGERYIQWGMLLTGLIIGVPLFYNVGFVLVVPIIFAFVYQYKLPAIYIGFPMLAALSVAHGFLPPHPSPAALVTIFHADIGITIFYGFIIGIPTMIIAGPLFAQTLKNIRPKNNHTLFKTKELPVHLPGSFNSFISALLPVFLLAITSLLVLLFPKNNSLQNIAQFIHDPSMLMFSSLVIVTFTLGISMKVRIAEIMRIYEDGIKEIVLILLIIGCSGALKQVLLDSGAGNQLANYFQHSSIHPLLLGWLIAATIRVCLGSATAAGLTAAGIIAPMVFTFHINSSLMVLSIGAGSLMFSHVNDPGFWMFKEYFNVSMKDTFRSWSLMETIISVAGLAGVFLLNSFIH